MSFITLAVCCCAITAVNGGRSGRHAAAMAISTILIGRAIGMVDLTFATSPGFKVALDGTLLAGFYNVMLNSRRHWPIWITGFQINGVVAHLTTWLVGDYTPAVYRGLESVWGIPIMVVMALGATLDNRAGLNAADGSDKAGLCLVTDRTPDGRFESQ